MRTTTKKLENAVTQIKVTFDKKEWAEAQDAALKRLATRVKLDGFRPGKAPVALCLQYHSPHRIHKTILAEVRIVLSACCTPAHYL